MNGDWLTFGIVGLLAAAGVARGSLNRQPSPRVRSVMLMHPRGSDVVDYLNAPTLRGWHRIRRMVIPGLDDSDMTIWRAVGRLGWQQESGKYSDPPLKWHVEAAAYPDDQDCYPSPVVVEKAILMALGLPAFVEAGPEGVLCGGSRGEVEEAEIFGGPLLTLYRGVSPNGSYWASEPVDVGIQVVMGCATRGPYAGRCTMWVVEGGERRVLSSRAEDGSVRLTGGLGAETAVADAWKRHKLDLELSEKRHWDEKGRLVLGPRK